MPKISKAEEVRKYIENKGGFLLSNYVNNKSSLVVKCSKGHIWYPIWINLQKGKWCKFCNSKKRITIDDAKHIALKRGGECLSEEIINSKTKLTWLCKDGHKFQSSFSNVKSGNTWCPYCAGNWRSEEICRSILEASFNKSFPKSRPYWLKNKNDFQLELDGFCEEIGLAFEHHGIQHYKDLKFFNSNKTFLQNIENDNTKLKLCSKFGVKLLIIPALFKKTKLKDLSGFISKELSRLGYSVEVKDVSLNYLSKNDFCKKQLETINKIAKSKEGICLSKVYINARTKLKFRCKHNHIWEASPDKIKKGTWCPSCARTNGILNKELFTKLHFEENKTFHQVCKELTVTRKFLLKQCKCWGIKPRLQSKFEVNPETLQKLLDKEYSTKEIADKFAVSRKTINNYVNKYNLKPLNKKLTKDICKRKNKRLKKQLAEVNSE